ncbi:MAG: TatD family nuclease-associated radical SAM protein [Candidatus Syntropharchaeia archaeon]
MSGDIVYRYGADTIYLNLTNRCTNDCIFCIKKRARGIGNYNLILDKEPDGEEILKKLSEEINEKDKEIVFCGFGEPTIRLPLILELSRKIKQRYPHIKLRLNTDGQAQLRYPDISVVKELADAGIDSISISLNAEDEERYAEVCRPSIEGAYPSMMKFVRECIEFIKEVRVTVVGGYADVEKCARIASNLGVDFKVR